MDWYQESRLVIHVKRLNKSEPARKVCVPTQVLTSLLTSRFGPRTTTDGTLWHRPSSHSSLVSKQHFSLFTRLIQQLPGADNAESDVGVGGPGPVRDSAVCFVRALIIRIVPGNSWGPP